LAYRPSDWVRHLEHLVKDPALRSEMSRNAAATAAKRLTLQANAPRIVAAFRSAVS
jgi:glycosyltransferase involved in cell wall biosynthesis